MRTPVLGFRGWRVARPQRSLEDPGLTATQAQRARDETLRSLPPTLVSDPKLDAWLASQAPQPRRRRYSVDHPDEEPGTLLSWSGGRGYGAARTSSWANPGPIRFHCALGHERPRRGCQCGLYAYLSANQLVSNRRQERPWFDAVGAVVAWGHIVIHGIEGFRAENARIVALSMEPAPTPGRREWSDRWARKAAERLGVPFVPFDRLEQVGREHGSPIRWRYEFE
jgi:hypothetical protein